MRRRDISSKAGFVALIGRPNAGKSALINAFVNDRIAMTSRKAGATRKKQLAIVTRGDSQIIFIDTPGLDNQSGKLRDFMRKEAQNAIEGADLNVFLADMADRTDNYETFLSVGGGKQHIVALTKMDNFTNERRIKKLAEYQKFSDRFLAIVPVSAKKNDFAPLLDEIAKRLPSRPFYYDPDDLTDLSVREIYAEMIRQALLDSFNDEVPYACCVEIESFAEDERLDKISAKIFVEKPSQMAIVIGKNGAGVKRVGVKARLLMEQFSQKKVFLRLEVAALRAWSKDDKQLARFGYRGGV
ncbi:MAG: GTPase Era [Helicobacteraceae bacterium]|jgi:GTP-binding protein Era|nr:GTPase Era [Helicobacteraceae bacterium]